MQHAHTHRHPRSCRGEELRGREEEEDGDVGGGAEDDCYSD